jgi:glutamine amidotransferase
MIGIIDYGMGNLASVENAMHFLGLDCAIVTQPDDVTDYDRLVLPGVGAFGKAMQHLTANGMHEAIKDFAANRGRPLLGICLGMQLLLSESVEYGTHAGLGLVPGRVKSLAELATDVSVPNIGWSRIERREHSRLLHGIGEDGLCFYFVHSYCCTVDDRDVVTGQLDHGVKFDVVIEKDNIFGCQFHPEKSQESGLHLLRNFATAT